MSAASSGPVLAIAGPTAAGKSQLALDVAGCARALGFDGAELVSVDSAQIYRGMDIGTAKPDVETQTRVPHHLIDILDPAEVYSAARFAADAGRVIADIRARGRLPILVGGTMLYYRALLVGLSDLPQADADVRAGIESDAQRLGWAVLHERLRAQDPQTAARLHPNDAQRIGRALEILALTGRPLDEAYARRPVDGLPGPVVRVVVCPTSREVLHRRIALRFEHMMEAGFLDEVGRLHARGDLHAALPSVRAVGYRQLWQFLDGQASLDEAVQQGIAATRRYAKRQLTWLRGESGWHWQSGAEVDTAVALLRDSLDRCHTE